MRPRLIAATTALAVLTVIGGTAAAGTTATRGVAPANAAATAVAVAADPPKLPQPGYSFVSEEVMIPMDDGVHIAATITYPSVDGAARAPGRFPVVLAMTPYSRNGVCGCISPALFATRGIVAVVADVRGTGGSEGTLKDNFFSPREARDSAAVIDHFGSQPWSSGKVGMAGGSYVGITQLLAASNRPKHLAAIVPMIAISDLYRDGYTHGGIVNLSFDAQYIAVQGAPGTAGTNNDPFLLEQSLLAKLGQSPPGSIAFDYLDKPFDHQFYRDRSPIQVADRIDVPVLDMGNWNDGLLRGQTEMFGALSKRKGVETRLFMDPCTHKGCGAPFAPFTNPPGRQDTAAVLFEFLSKHLLGTGTPKRPNVEFYLQGKNTYVSSSTWPPAGTRYERLALGDETLTPAAADGEVSYVTSPAAGFSLAFNKYGTVAGTPYIPTDQRLEGPNGATFRTPVLEQPLRLTGPIGLHLVAKSSADDTDWYAKLADVAPDGTETIMTEGALRASHRELDQARSRPERPYHPHTNTTPIEPGRFYDYEIEIWPTAWELAPGHRLQLRVTSSDLPTHLPGSFVFDKDNPKNVSIDLNDPATNTIRLGASHLVLPISNTASAATGPPAAPAGTAPTSQQPAYSESLPATGPALAAWPALALVLVGAAVRRRSSDS
jgi:putative CocE/NonD family hydrolase